jgi:hypothetical protein
MVRAPKEDEDLAVDLHDSLSPGEVLGGARKREGERPQLGSHVGHARTDD